MNAAMCGQIGAVKNKLSNNVHAPRFFFFFVPQRKITVRWF